MATHAAPAPPPAGTHLVAGALARIHQVHVLIVLHSDAADVAARRGVAAAGAQPRHRHALRGRRRRAALRRLPGLLRRGGGGGRRGGTRRRRRLGRLLLLLLLLRLGRVCRLLCGLALLLLLRPPGQQAVHKVGLEAVSRQAQAFTLGPQLHDRQLGHGRLAGRPAARHQLRELGRRIAVTGRRCHHSEPGAGCGPSRQQAGVAAERRRRPRPAA